LFLFKFREADGDCVPRPWGFDIGWPVEEPIEEPTEEPVDELPEPVDAPGACERIVPHITKKQPKYSASLRGFLLVGNALRIN